jgi:hypothetical protein
MHLARFHVAMRLMLWLPCLLSVQTLGKLNELIEENEVTGTCANGVCTVHGPGGKAEYSEVFEEFVPAFFAGAQVCRSCTHKRGPIPSQTPTSPACCNLIR